MNVDQVRPGDQIIGVSSSGLHSNGYALARKVLLKDAKLSLTAENRTLGEPLGDALLRPTRIYVPAVLAVLNNYKRRRVVTAMAHVTGGGMEGNLPRVLPDNCDAVVRRGSWPIPPIFALLERYNLAEDEMYRVFNMGVGYVLVVRPTSTSAVLKLLEKAGEEANVIGEIKRGRGRVEFQ
jgi:phosphoribosylformylglycinamidine cyclo-ligase